MEPKNYFEMLPKEVQLHLFSFLDVKSCGRLARISVAWERQCCASDAVWKRIFPGIEEIIPYGFRSHIKRANLKRIDSIVQLKPIVQSFCEQMSRRQGGWFSCSFPHNRQCVAMIEFQPREPDPKATWYARYMLATPLDREAEFQSMLSTNVHARFLSCHFEWPSNSANCSNLFYELAEIVKNKDLQLNQEGQEAHR